MVPLVRGVAAGIWDGSQLDVREAHDLAKFCGRLARESAPVIALLDFPRRDRCEIARQAGAVVVLGKPWNNADLMTSLDVVIQNAPTAGAA
jgi:AmiR/NasT family two-component response regulator